MVIKENLSDLCIIVLKKNFILLSKMELCHGHFEYMVADSPHGWSNNLQDIMNFALQECLEHFMLVYLDDMGIF